MGDVNVTVDRVPYNDKSPMTSSMTRNHGGAGKGDLWRPHDQDKWSKNYDRIFGKKDKQ
jgi:hypothetical protein